MSGAKYYHYSSCGDLIPQSSHQFLKEQLHFPHHFCKSAPSRLQHFGGVFPNDISTTSRAAERSNSLTNLFQRSDFYYQNSLDDQGFQHIYKLHHTMPIPSSSTTDTDESLIPSPLHPVHVQKNFCADANNNDESEIHDDCDTISQTSSTSLEGVDERRSCFGSNGARARTQAFVEDAQSKDWKHLIRRDTFKLHKLNLDDKTAEIDENFVLEHEAIEKTCSDTTPVIDDAVHDNDDVESISSFSSDET